MSMYPLSKIAAGHNNAGGLVAWESITPTGGTAFYAPVVYGGFDPGQRSTLLDGTDYFNGYPLTSAVWGAITQIQVYYLQTTYCAGGYTGNVTVAVRTQSPSSYVNYNAILKLPKLSESTKRSMAYENYTAQLTRLIAI